MRWSESDLKKTTKGKAVCVQGSVGGLAEKKKPESAPRIDRVLASIQMAKLAGRVIPGVYVEVAWQGMSLLTLNELLRIDHRQLHAYRRACHECVQDAMWSLSGQSFGLRFQGPVTMKLLRTGKRLVDADGLYPAFKFLIDGFRYAGVIADDDPLHIVQMTHDQSVGDPEIGLRIEIAEPQNLLASPCLDVAPVVAAWDMINGLGLNKMISVGNASVMRFLLVDANGNTKPTPMEAGFLFDMQTGKTFLPQTDAEWLDQLMTRFRMGVQWDESCGAWVSVAAPGVSGQGATPGVAVVNALAAAVRVGCLPGLLEQQALHSPV